jgi:hypothetical protein
MIVYVPEAHTHVKRLVLVVKMATAFEECTTEEKRCVMRFFLLAKRLNANDIHKKIFPVYGGECLSLKAVHICAEKFSHGISKVADDDMKVRKWLRHQSKRILCCRFWT